MSALNHSEIESAPITETGADPIYLRPANYPDSLNPAKIESKFDGYRVELVDPSDSRIPEAHEMEVFNMVELGDPEGEVRDEMLQYHSESAFILATDESGNLAGMMRIVPFTPAKGIKTFNDLAEILTYKWQSDLDYSPTDQERAQQYNINFSQIQSEFFSDTGQYDLTKVWDVPTLATRLNEHSTKRVEIAQVLVAALAQVTIKGNHAGELTHVMSFNQVEADNFFRKLGYPITTLNGYPPMVYDSYGSGVGITAQPAWFSVGEVETKVNEVQATPQNYPRHTVRHMARIAISSMSETA